MSSIEKYLSYLTKESSEIPIPFSDVDKFLYYLCTGEGQLPSPDTRIEKYLSQLCLNGPISDGTTLLTSYERVVQNIPSNAIVDSIYYVLQQ